MNVDTINGLIRWYFDNTESNKKWVKIYSLAWLRDWLGLSKNEIESMINIDLKKAKKEEIEIRKALINAYWRIEAHINDLLLKWKIWYNIWTFILKNDFWYSDKIEIDNNNNNTNINFDYNHKDYEHIEILLKNNWFID